MCPIVFTSQSTWAAALQQSRVHFLEDFLVADCLVADFLAKALASLAARHGELVLALAAFNLEASFEPAFSAFATILNQDSQVLRKGMKLLKAANSTRGFASTVTTMTKRQRRDCSPLHSSHAS
jgi:hypothetical protein